MKELFLFVGVVLLLAALYFHAIAQANVIKKIEVPWFEKLFTGSRAKMDNLTEAGKRSRKHSNLCAVGGFLLLGICFLI